MILMHLSLVEVVPGLTLAQLLFTLWPHLNPEVWTISQGHEVAAACSLMPQAYGSRALSKNCTHYGVKIKETRKEIHDELPFSRSMQAVRKITNGLPRGH